MLGVLSNLAIIVLRTIELVALTVFFLSCLCSVRRTVSFYHSAVGWPVAVVFPYHTHSRIHSGKSVTIRESNLASGVHK